MAEGYLLKRKSKKHPLSFSNTVQRYFVLDLEKGVFGYKSSREAGKMKKEVPLSEFV